MLPRHRAEWLAKIAEPGVRLRAERFYQQLDLLQPVRQEARRDLLVESHKHPAREVTAPDSFDRSDSCRLAGGACCRRHTVSVPSANCGPTVVSQSRLTTAASTALCEGNCDATGSASRVRGLNDNHNRDLKNLFKSAAISASTRPGPLLRFLCGSAGERDAADHGASHPGTENRRHYFNHLEERSGFRRQTITSASSLSISEESGFSISGDSLGGGRSGSGDARFEGEYQSMRSAPCASAPSHPLHAMPPRITRNSDRPRASDRTMVTTQHQSRLPSL